MIAIAVTTLAPGTAPQTAHPEGKLDNQQASCRSFVQGFYDWYVPRALKANTEPAWTLAVIAKPHLFSPRLRQLLMQDATAQREAAKTSGELVGLDFDPFLNSQDPSEKFAVESVTGQGPACIATVHGISSGQKQETVTAFVQCKGANCQFVNFRYPDDKGNTTDLLTILKSTR